MTVTETEAIERYLIEREDERAKRKLSREFRLPVVGRDRTYPDCPVVQDRDGKLWVLYPTGHAAPTVEHLVVRCHDHRDCD